ncbi:MAG: CAP domain-containing protein [Bacteroidales bacterium]|nr:CAP domain-containing protein [Bacteroidales bacterium]
MKNTILVIGFLLIAVSLSGQSDFYGINFQNEKYSFKDWNLKTLTAANTCADVGYMTEEEKKVVFLINLLRADSRLFATTFMLEFLESQRYKPSEELNMLTKQLKKNRKLPMLHPDKDLYRVSEDFANKNGRSGKVGNKGYKARYAKIKKQYSYILENYHYGHSEAIYIVMQMLLDENDAQKQNRKNLLNKKINSIGISIRPHSKYNFNTVAGLATRR